MSQESDPWTIYMTPSSVHELLSAYKGDYAMQLEMDGLSEKVIVNSHHQMILGGRFLQLKQQGSLMGMPYESLYTLGYNTIDQSFFVSTITNMGTGTLALKGVWDEVNRTATVFGSITNPVSGSPIKVRQTIEFFEDLSIVIQSFDQEGDGQEKKTVQYTFVKL